MSFKSSIRKAISLLLENELKEWEEKCAEADRNVLYIVNHDLKSPLTAVAIKAALLSRQLRDDLSPPQTELLEKALIGRYVFLLPINGN